jgi:TM2 domain-containing membrane protein YozV
MKCALHTEVDATGFCRNCGKALCEACKRDVRGILYCEDCLAAVVTQPQPVPGAPNPALAAVLGLIPGLGAVYNGQYMKGLMHLLIFAGLIAMAEHVEVFGLFVAAFYIYMPIEAYRTAKARLLGQPLSDPFADLGANQPIGAFLLIALGVLLLLDNISGLNIWRWVENFWPVLLIVIGVWLLRKRIQPTSGGGNQS